MVSVPGGQKWPIAHVSDGADRPAEGQEAPALHGKQEARLVPRSCGLYVPAAQSLGAVEALGQ